MVRLREHERQRNQIRTDTDGEAGFSVIELLIAFTVLAIVAGSLFQMFFIAARNNAKALEYDQANNLVITAAELFKADPTFSAGLLSMADPGEIAGKTWVSADGVRRVKYYDKDWTEQELTIAVSGEEPIPPIQAEYKLSVSVRREESTPVSEENYLSAALDLELSVDENSRIVIHELAGNIEVLFNGKPQHIQSQNITKAVPINLVFVQEGIIPKKVVVLNKTSLPVNLQVFNLPNQVDPARADYIEVIPAEGDLGVLYLEEGLESTKNSLYYFQADVTKLSEEQMELAKVEARKYVAG